METLKSTSFDTYVAEGDLNRILNNFTKNIGIVESDIGNQNIIFNNLSEDVYVMNVTGKIIWHSLHKDSQLGDIISALKAWFTGGVNSDEATIHTASFLTKLESEGLIYVEDNAAKGNFPVGRIINITQNQPNVVYEEPIIIKYNRAILKEKHPEVFYRTQFSDTWGPATTGDGLY